MNISCFKLCTLISLFSTKIATSELPSNQKVICAQNKCSTFARDIIDKKSFVGAYKKEEDPARLCRMRRAECMFCGGVLVCVTAGYGAIACASDPASAFILGSVSGCGASTACTMRTNNDTDYSCAQPKDPLTKEDVLTIIRKEYPQLTQQQMSIAPSPIESSINPVRMQ